MKKTDTSKIFSFRYWFYDFVKITSAIPGYIAYRPKILYQSEAAKKRIKGAAVLISNHIGFFDPIYVMFTVWYRRHHFICTKEFFEGKKRFFFKNFMCIPIDRDNFGVDSFREIVDHLKNGELVSMFPEGRIENEMHSFKSGMVLMAMYGNAPIVPVYIKKRSSWLERLTVMIGDPIDVKEQLGGQQGMSKIESVAELLYSREMKLKEMCEGR